MWRAARSEQPLLWRGGLWLVVAAMLALLGSSAWTFSKLGAEFIPQLDEGDFAFQLIRSSSVSLSSSLELQKQSEAIIRKEYPEVKEIFARLVELNRERSLPILLVEQNAHLALEVSSFGYVLETGRVLLADSSTALRDSPEVRSAYLGG